MTDLEEPEAGSSMVVELPEIKCQCGLPAVHTEDGGANWQCLNCWAW